MSKADFGTYARTLRHLEVSQVAARLRGEVRRRLDAVRGPRGVVHARRGIQGPVGWPENFESVDSVTCPISSRSIVSGQLELLGHTVSLGPPEKWPWNGSARERLWTFHLNYWDWAYGLARDRPDYLRILWEHWWRSTRYAIGDEWEPYVVALRLWSSCGLFDAFRGSGLENVFLDSLKIQQQYLSKHLEIDLRGNHYIKNLKALAGVSAFFRQPDMRQAFETALTELERQVLSDGGHEERSPSYHFQVMTDAFDLKLLSEMLALPTTPRFQRLVERMAAWFDCVTLSSGPPLVNDGYPIPDSQLNYLRLCGVLHHETPTSRHTPRVTVLNDSGYVRVDIGDFEHLLDIGPLGPSHNPGHGHADTLSMLTTWRGRQILVDTGTTTYSISERRQYERSTRAHNTVAVNKSDSSEVWSTFRVGRRATCRLLLIDQDDSCVRVSAEHAGYMASFGAVHRREWTFTPHRVTVLDTVTRGDAEAEAFLHLPRSAPVHLGPDTPESASPPLRVTFADAHGSPAPFTTEVESLGIGWKRTQPGTLARVPVPAAEGAKVLRTTIEVVAGG